MMSVIVIHFVNWIGESFTIWFVTFVTAPMRFALDGYLNWTHFPRRSTWWKCSSGIKSTKKTADKWPVMKVHDSPASIRCSSSRLRHALAKEYRSPSKSSFKKSVFESRRSFEPIRLSRFRLFKLRLSGKTIRKPKNKRFIRTAAMKRTQQPAVVRVEQLFLYIEQRDCSVSSFFEKTHV